MKVFTFLNSQKIKVGCRLNIGQYLFTDYRIMSPGSPDCQNKAQCSVSMITYLYY